ncbi:BTAD domain-containing putative transcriptional regulator [Streptomyces sp. NPDC001940]|uniref:BTAD domain-containing putative transcriptional regulator n=1 Tax=unclassified Streptomyces TaxID=2593676 RepID=UPI00363BED73
MPSATADGLRGKRARRPAHPRGVPKSYGIARPGAGGARGRSVRHRRLRTRARGEAWGRRDLCESLCRVRCGAARPRTRAGRQRGSQAADAARGASRRGRASGVRRRAGGRPAGRAAPADSANDAEPRLMRHADALVAFEVAGRKRLLSERSAGLRMRSPAAAGRRSDAFAVYDETRGRLGGELGVDLPAELREIHLVLLRGELEGPVARPEAAPSTMSAPLTSFVGRDGELEGPAALLAGSRLVTLVGPGGAGKTRLSVEAVTRQEAYRRGRVWFVPFAGVGTPGRLGGAVLGALGSWDLRGSDVRQAQKSTPMGR